VKFGGEPSARYARRVKSKTVLVTYLVTLPWLFSSTLLSRSVFAETPPTSAAPHVDTRQEAKDFASEVKLLFRAAACGTLSETPEAMPLDGAVVSKHCALLRPLMDAYAQFWQSNIEPTLAKYVPRDKATTVVYPFGGGDLVTSLGTYPEVTDLTSLSLESVGDARGIQKLTPAQLSAELGTIRRNLTLLFRVKHSRTDNLGVMTRGGISGQLVFALVALSVRGYEPVALRYFSVRPDGVLDYVSEAEAADADAHAFANAEIEFRRPGQASRFFRHINANLDNEHLKADPGPVKYLEAKGRVMAITKAASYLLWWDNFTTIREYLVDHMDFMISDSTGVPPEIAAAKGFKQFTFGDFDGAYLADANKKVGAQFKTMWHTQKKRPIDFRYGYPDVNKNAHMLITTKLAISGLD
jgi:hypothetical protein